MFRYRTVYALKRVGGGKMAYVFDKKENAERFLKGYQKANSNTNMKYEVVEEEIIINETRT